MGGGDACDEWSLLSRPLFGDLRLGLRAEG